MGVQEEQRKEKERVVRGLLNQPVRTADPMQHGRLLSGMGCGWVGGWVGGCSLREGGQLWGGGSSDPGIVAGVGSGVPPALHAQVQSMISSHNPRTIHVCVWKGKGS